jgi:hypothetical protein
MADEFAVSGPFGQISATAVQVVPPVTNFKACGGMRLQLESGGVSFAHQATSFASGSPTT